MSAPSRHVHARAAHPAAPPTAPSTTHGPAARVPSPGRPRHAAAPDRRAEAGEQPGDGRAGGGACGGAWPAGSAPRHDGEGPPAWLGGTQDQHDRAAGRAAGRAAAPGRGRAADRAAAVPLGRDDSRAAGGGPARADIVPLDRAAQDDEEEEARLAREGLQFRNLPFGSLTQILRYAKTAQFNFSHIPFVRALSIAFYYWVTVPVLTVMWLIAWVYFLRFHRAVWAWPVTLVIAAFLNRVADWAVPDWLVVTTWSATALQAISGGLVVLVLTAVVVLRWGPSS